MCWSLEGWLWSYHRETGGKVDPIILFLIHDVAVPRRWQPPASAAASTSATSSRRRRRSGLWLCFGMAAIFLTNCGNDDDDGGGHLDYYCCYLEKRSRDKQQRMGEQFGSLLRRMTRRSPSSLFDGPSWNGLSAPDFWVIPQLQMQSWRRPEKCELSVENLLTRMFCSNGHWSMHREAWPHSSLPPTFCDDNVATTILECFQETHALTLSGSH